MKKILFILIFPFVIACAKKIEKPQINADITHEDEIYLKANFVLQNQKLLRFIDSFIDRCKKTNSLDSLDVNDNFYLLYIYQNDFFTRFKLSFFSPSKVFLKYISLGTGYFEYQGRVFILVTGIDRICTQDSSLQKEFQTKYKNRIDKFDEHLRNDVYRIRYFQPFTWEADIAGDTIFIKEGTNNPCNPPPSDTSELYKYIRSVKSFTIH
jgi:hypothetical protein